MSRHQPSQQLLAHLERCPASHCQDCGECGAGRALLIVAADLGAGAFVDVLCDTCWHRRQYHAELERRRRDRITPRG